MIARRGFLGRVLGLLGLAAVPAVAGVVAKPEYVAPSIRAVGSRVDEVAWVLVATGGRGLPIFVNAIWGHEYAKLTQVVFQAQRFPTDRAASLYAKSAGFSGFLPMHVALSSRPVDYVFERPDQPA